MVWMKYYEWSIVNILHGSKYGSKENSYELLG